MNHWRMSKNKPTTKNSSNKSKHSKEASPTRASAKFSRIQYPSTFRSNVQRKETENGRKAQRTSWRKDRKQGRLGTGNKQTNLINNFEQVYRKIKPNNCWTPSERS